MEPEEDVFQAVVLGDNFEQQHMFGEDCPIRQECLLPLVDRLVVDYALESLSSSGVDEIFLVVSKEVEKVREHIKTAGWSRVSVVGCEGARSFGDALRELDARGLLRSGAFALLLPGVVTNLNFRALRAAHQKNEKTGAGVVATWLRRVGDLHAPTPPVVCDKNGRVLWCEKNSKGKLKIPMDKVVDCCDVWGDLNDPGIYLCSPAFLPLFTDNFDFASMADFMRGLLLNEELLQNFVYVERMEKGYASRVRDEGSFFGVWGDVVGRWALPLAPPNPPYSPAPHLVFKHKKVTVFPGAFVSGSVLDFGSVVGKGAVVRNSFLGAGTCVGAGTHLNHVFLAPNSKVGADSNLNKVFLHRQGETLKDGARLFKVFYSDGEEFEFAPPDQSDGEDSASDSSHSSQQHHVLDQDIKKFREEVFESLLRAGKDVSNVVIEVNGSKYSNNISFNDVAPVLTHAVLQLDSDLTKNPKSRWTERERNLKRFAPLFKNYAKDPNAQLEILKAIEETCGESDNLGLIPRTLHALYDLDIVEDQVFFTWHATKQLLFPFSTTIRDNTLKFIEWLGQTSEEEEDDE